MNTAAPLTGPAEDITPAAPLDRASAVRRDVYNGLVSCIVSNERLWSTVDVSELRELMSGPLDALPDQPLQLAPLWDYMARRGTPRDAAIETILFFHSRAARWHVELRLPPALETLAARKREEIVARVAARGVTSGTYVGPAPTARPRRAARAAAVLDRPAVAPHGPGAAVTRAALGLAFAASVALHFLPAEVEDEALGSRVAAAMGDACATVELTGFAARCAVTAAARAEAERTAERARLTLAALEVDVLFVDANGEPTQLD